MQALAREGAGARDWEAAMQVDMAGLSRFRHSCRGQSCSQVAPSPLWQGRAAQEQLKAFSA